MTAPVDIGGVGCLRKPLVDSTRDRGRVGAHALDGVLGRRLADEGPQDVEGVEFALAALERERAGLLQQLLRAQAEEAREVDRTRRASTLAVEIAREELVEGARAVLAVLRGEVFGHSLESLLIKLESDCVKFRYLSELVSSSTTPHRAYSQFTLRGRPRCRS